MMKKFNHILSVDQFNKDDIADIFSVAKSLETPKPQLLSGKVQSNLFYEPSTRTSSSFYSAMVSLGGSVIPINDVNYSSVIKGENLADTVRTLASYSDIIILRSKEAGQAELAAAYSPVPIINAGDGDGEHPTQALLDLYTIYKEHGRIDGLTITFMGDLKYSRTVHSLVKLLRMYDVQINFVAPYELTIQNEYIEDGDIIRHDIDIDVLANTDVLYVTRAQLERFADGEAPKAYRIDESHLTHMSRHATIMHPLPRVNEIAPEIDSDPRAAYFRQMKNGLYIRRALLKLLLT